MPQSFRVLRAAPAARSVTLATAVAVSSLAPGASAATSLSVDLSTSLHPVTHAASGSLYGLTEKTPADLNALVAPLLPNVFNNPAADVQQPVGDAITVAGRVAPLGARVSIRLADWFPGWPYRFTNMNDWFDKLGQTASRKLASGVDDYYGYEIWNEPNGTWTSTMSFNDFWKQTYDKLRELDPGAKIIGPSISFYDASYLKNFLSYAKANDCMPDIVSWHELSGGNLTANFQGYRALEQMLGIGPLPISINEYSGKNDLNDEGMPGASAPMIAKFERFGVDSACISYWDVAHPGRLGSLLASDTSPNGGWWFYKWYGDMRGTMVATTPPAPNDAAALDGFANLDAAAQKVSVLFAGVNDDTIDVVVQGFGAVPFFGSKVHAVVEHTPWVNRSTAVSMTDTIMGVDVAIAADRVSVSVPGTNDTDGYRLTLIPVDAGAGNVGGMGGAAGARSSNGGAGSANGGAPAGIGGALGVGGLAGGGAGVSSEAGRAAGVADNAGATTAAGASGGGVGGAFGSGTSGGGATAANAGRGVGAGLAGIGGAAGVAELTAGSGGAQRAPARAANAGCACAIERRASTRGAELWALFVVCGLMRRRARPAARHAVTV